MFFDLFIRLQLLFLIAENRCLHVNCCSEESSYPLLTILRCLERCGQICFWKLMRLQRISDLPVPLPLLILFFASNLTSEILLLFESIFFELFLLTFQRTVLWAKSCHFKSQIHLESPLLQPSLWHFTYWYPVKKNRHWTCYPYSLVPSSWQCL